MNERRQRFSMFREYTLADLFTLGNAACGTVAIFLCLQYIAEDEKRFLWTTFVLLPAAFALDAVDGWVARTTGKGSRLGADLDSLADTVSFGVAPAVLLYTLGARGAWDAILLVYFVCCGISRLARFNVTAEALEDPETGKVRYFEGTPIPTSLALVGLLGVAFRFDWIHAELLGGLVQLGPWQLHPITLLYAVSGSLMISTIRIPKP
jgi:CDP-diacylglycerol--serine O-phosphatidyltransferase